MNFLVVTVFTYPYMRPTYPNVIDFFNGSISSSYSNTTSSINGSYKALHLTNTPKGAMTSFAVGIRDKSWNETYYNKSINTQDPPQNLIRDIVVNYGLYDGNFTSSSPLFWSCEGYYYPNVSRGIADCVYDSGFGDPKFELDNISIAKQALDLDQQWPNVEQYEIAEFNKKFEQGENGELKAKKQKSVIFFTLNRVPRENSKRYDYPPDNQKRSLWHQEGVILDNNTSQFWVPQIDLVVINQEIGYTFNVTSQISNSAFQQKHGLVFYVIIVFVQIGFAMCNIKLAIDTDTIIRLTSLNIGSLAFYINSQYLTTMLFIASPNMVSGLTNIQAFLGFVNIGSLFPMILRIVVVYAQQMNQQQHYCKSLGIILGITLGTIVPAVVVIIIAYFIPVLATFIIVLICCSYLFAYTIILLVKNYRPSYPIYFVILNCLDKTVILSYLFGIENCYGIEFKAEWWQGLVGLFLIQLLIYIIQLYAGPRCGVKCRNRNVFSYQNNGLNAKTIQQLKATNCRTQPQDQLISFQKPHSTQILSFRSDEAICKAVCANPTHTHSKLYKSKTVTTLQQCNDYVNLMSQLPQHLMKIENAEYLSNCFTYIQKETLEEFSCTICFDRLPIEKANDGLFMRLFNDTNSQLYRLETNYLKGKSNIQQKTEDIWTTPCGHSFHASCLAKWMEENCFCPVDKQELKQAE